MLFVYSEDQCVRERMLERYDRGGNVSVYTKKKGGGQRNEHLPDVCDDGRVDSAVE